MKVKKKSSAAAPPPAPPPVAPLPDEGDEVLRRQARSAARNAARRSGYTSTILSGQVGDAARAGSGKTLLGQ